MPSHFRVLSRLLALTILTLPLTAQQHWGDITAKGCSKNGVREWSGVLWAIPAGESWEDACARTPAIEGGRPPDRCVNSLSEWGIWDVPDRGCLSTPHPMEPLVFHLAAANATPDRNVRVEYLFEHHDLVDPYTIAPDPNKGTYALTSRPRSTATRRVSFPYEGGQWTIHVRASVVMENGTELPLDETTQNIFVPFDSAESFGDFVSYTVARSSAPPGYTLMISPHL